MCVPKVPSALLCLRKCNWGTLILGQETQLRELVGNSWRRLRRDDSAQSASSRFERTPWGLRVLSRSSRLAKRARPPPRVLRHSSDSTNGRSLADHASLTEDCWGWAECCTRISLRRNLNSSRSRTETMFVPWRTHPGKPVRIRITGSSPQSR